MQTPQEIGYGQTAIGELDKVFDTSFNFQTRDLYAFVWPMGSSV